DRIVFRIDGYPTLRTAERHIDDGTLKGHQRSECHHFVFIDHFTEAYTAFCRRHVLRVLYTPGVDHLKPVAPPKRKAEAIDTVADFNLIEQALRVLGKLGSVVKKR